VPIGRPPARLQYRSRADSPPPDRPAAAGFPDARIEVVPDARTDRPPSRSAPTRPEAAVVRDDEWRRSGTDRRSPGPVRV